MSLIVLFFFNKLQMGGEAGFPTPLFSTKIFWRFVPKKFLCKPLQKFFGTPHQSAGGAGLSGKQTKCRWGRGVLTPPLPFWAWRGSRPPLGLRYGGPRLTIALPCFPPGGGVGDWFFSEWVTGFGAGDPGGGWTGFSGKWRRRRCENF